MDGWRRDMYWDDTGLTWIISSPNIPTFDTTTVYPGGVLFEGTNVSEGRGTTRPFELIGAPWIVAERFADAMNRRDLPGVFFRPAVFEPTFQKHAGTAVRRVSSPRPGSARLRPVEAGVALIEAFRASDPDQFRWKDPPTIRVREDADRLSRGILNTARTDRRRRFRNRNRSGLEGTGRRVSENSRARPLVLAEPHQYVGSAFRRTYNASYACAAP